MNTMQAAAGSRNSKRSTIEPPNPPQSTVNTSSRSGAGARSSSGSSKSSNYKTQNPGQQLSQIEKSVTHLLVATKQLLETLTQWSRHNATEGEVSDVYVRLGYEFNIAVRAFNGIGVDCTDLGPVPEMLRSILEETLSQEASPASLDRFLPRIRDIIINLLHGLKRKQQRLRAKQAKDGQSNGTSLPGSASASSFGSGFNQILDDTSSRKSGGRGSEKKTGSGGNVTGDSTNGEYTSGPEILSRYSTAPVRQSSGAASIETPTRSNRDSQRPFSNSVSDSSISSDASQSASILSSASEDASQWSQSTARQTSQRDQTPFFQPPPPPPPKQQDALAALQRGGDLERRASRRYSAYQISKHLGASTNGIPMLPPTQTTPVPNRGRDLRDSMNAVRTRGSGIYGPAKPSPRTGESSPSRTTILSNRISEESSQSGGSRDELPELASEEGRKAIDGPRKNAHASALGDRPQVRATLTSPLETLPIYEASDYEPSEPSKSGMGTISIASKTSALEGDQLTQQFVPEQSPQPDKDLTLFLQYKTRIKKFVLPGGSTDLSIARLQLAFIEKFAWNTHSNGNDLPEIYVQDPVSGVRHELEDLQDVKDRSVLVLNVEALDEVKKHIDEGFGGIRRLVEGVRSIVETQHISLQRVSDRQQDTSREVARLSLKPEASPVLPNFVSNSKPSANQAANVRSLRQDLALVRQTFTSLVSDMNSSMNDVKERAASVKTMAIEGVVPDLDSATGRSYVNTGKKDLGDESEKILNEVDDLQDVVEDLRKDVVIRGVRPRPRQLEDVSKSISKASSEVKKLQEFLRREKPIWTKIWEKELEVVCQDRDYLTMQEDLATDLEDDLAKATETFALVEQATKQQNIQASQGSGVTLRSTSKGLAAIANGPDEDVDPMKAKDGVLGEVRALRPNHETRLEAIERADKARKRELAVRKEGEFAKEVATFVEEGKLKKSGGVEETERLRRARDEKNMREAWEKQQERVAAKASQREDSQAPLDAAEPEAESLDPQLSPFPAAESEEKPDVQAIEASSRKENEGHKQDPPPSPSKRTSWLPTIFAS
ncbi:uncharacterized protein KY384_007025 [Bacidia gigantensis]|uniref:uncharacterized protein n=1 Tax=Bacidia gigantensis TaxID=2732470 RepID=UPI001D0426D3|nr:uncharacterized protein KY384_007025 [Bacidia gigantensis]KAG8528109.1 hypothetical protein KY384_007025 [Bacidia gigantensis]